MELVFYIHLNLKFRKNIQILWFFLIDVLNSNLDEISYHQITKINVFSYIVVI